MTKPRYTKDALVPVGTPIPPQEIIKPITIPGSTSISNGVSQIQMPKPRKNIKTKPQPQAQAMQNIPPIPALPPLPQQPSTRTMFSSEFNEDFQGTITTIKGINTQTNKAKPKPKYITSNGTTALVSPYTR
jgi:hypothetical protein